MISNYVAINGVTKPEKIRVFIYSSGRMVHVSLNELLKPLNEEIENLKKRIEKLEGK